MNSKQFDEWMRSTGYSKGADGEWRKGGSCYPAQSAKSKQVVCNEPMAEKKREIKNTNRFHVLIVSFRKRLCDPDNLCPKYFIDCLRYAEIIPNDRPQDIDLTVKQVKAKNERTEITVTKL